MFRLTFRLAGRRLPDVTKAPFERIVEQHGATVLRVCRAVLGPHDAQDAWSETFLAALRAYPDLPAGANVAGLAGDHRAPQGDRHHQGAGAGGRAGRDPPEARMSTVGIPRAADQTLGGRRRAADQTATGRRLPLPGRTATHGGRRDHRRHHGCGPPSRRRRHQDAAATTLASKRMDVSINDRHSIRLADLLARLYDPDPAALSRLRDSLVGAAAAAGLLDIAYRTLDTPVGTLLLAAHRAGPGPGGLRPRGSRPGAGGAGREDQPAHPAVAGAGWTASPVNCPSTSPAAEESSTCRWTSGCSSGFRRSVLAHLPEIAYGHTESYAQVAAAAGSPRAVRAVGSACATNPLPVVVPCHRVVRSDGCYGQYRGGEEAKRSLLTLESAA